MLHLTLLGSSAAVPDEAHENVYMVLHGPGGAVLIDCAGSPLDRLRRAGVAWADLRAVVLTHFHPDHVYGLPLLLMSMWLMGRREGLSLLGVGDCLKRTQAMMELYDWQGWNGFYPVTFTPTCGPGGASSPGQESIFKTDDVSLYAAPNRHSVPGQALKIVARRTGRVLVYSSDTEPCQTVVELAQGADVLIHEATGIYPGHSSPAAAGAIARQARVGKLVLAHYPPDADPQAWLAQARQSFDGPVEMARDFQVIEL
jgi:ribonuclease Z